MGEYVKNVLKIAGIPIDTEASNGGFVEAPNDCMAFDFSECWNTPKSISFCLPPPDYNVEEHGAWVGPTLEPFVALAGDALLEPFWPLGLGLKRGWQAVLDTAYAVDNLYHRTLMCESLGKDPNTFDWGMHFEALHDQIKENFLNCSKAEVAEDLGKGEYQAESIVMKQWKKIAGEQEKPEFLCEIDPATRYEKPNLALNSKQKRLWLDDKDWQHPVVHKFMAIRKYSEDIKKNPERNGWKKLISVSGKTVETPKGGYAFKAPDPTPAKLVAIPTAEVTKVSERKRDSLMRQVTSAQIDDHIDKASNQRRTQVATAQNAMLEALKVRQGADHSTEDLHHIGYVGAGGDSIAERSEVMWDRMLEKGMTPAQVAELAHIRSMIGALQTSIEGYRKAEKAILMGQS